MTTTEKKSENEKDRTVFDTEMIRAATHQKNRPVEFTLENGDTVRGIPITVDKFHILVLTDDEEEWIAKSAIVRCRIDKSNER